MVASSGGDRGRRVMINAALSSEVINARNWGSRVLEPCPCFLSGVLGGWVCHPSEMAGLRRQEGGDQVAPRDGFGGSRQDRA